MDLGLRGRVAAVAGASSGLGLAIARALAAEGADVAISARDRGRLEAARDAVDAAGEGRVTAASVNVRDTEAVRSWIDGVADARGALHIVVPNAGGPPGGTATAFDVDAYRDAVELNLLSQIAITNAALPHLRAAGWGRIIFVGSVSIRQPIPTLALSNTARAGIAGYATSLVADLGDSGITVNVLAPGYHATSRLEEVIGDDEDARAAITDDIPLGRMGDPADLGAIAAFLAGEQANYITGAVIGVDGGLSRSLL
ncbi:MAG: SDR family oxidoreductase [Actinobacteria bacterium]|nr:SDR family oxidoreductase [Actinomycetota bacterium]